MKGKNDAPWTLIMVARKPLYCDFCDRLATRGAVVEDGYISLYCDEHYIDGLNNFRVIHAWKLREELSRDYFSIIDSNYVSPYVTAILDVLDWLEENEPVKFLVRNKEGKTLLLTLTQTEVK